MPQPAKTDSALDAEELLHLAILDTQSGRHDAAIAKLKQAALLAPNHAKVAYLLAAEHAEIGLYERAIEGMKKAVTLDPSLTTAHLQLGLLFYTQGRVAEAKQAWTALDTVGPDDPLYLFKSALLQIDGGAAGEALKLLQRASQGARSNPALARDITRVMTNLQQRSAGADGAGSAAPPAASHRLATKYTEAGGE